MKDAKSYFLMSKLVFLVLIMAMATGLKANGWSFDWYYKTVILNDYINVENLGYEKSQIKWSFKYDSKILHVDYIPTNQTVKISVIQPSENNSAGPSPSGPFSVTITATTPDKKTSSATVTFFKKGFPPPQDQTASGTGKPKWILENVPANIALKRKQFAPVIIVPDKFPDNSIELDLKK